MSRRVPGVRMQPLTPHPTMGPALSSAPMNEPALIPQVRGGISNLMGGSAAMGPALQGGNGQGGHSTHQDHSRSQRHPEPPTASSPRGAAHTPQVCAGSRGAPQPPALSPLRAS